MNFKTSNTCGKLFFFVFSGAIKKKIHDSKDELKATKAEIMSKKAASEEAVQALTAWTKSELESLKERLEVRLNIF